MISRVVAGQLPVLLNPVSLGWLVNWREEGYFLDRTIQGAKERGIASAAVAPMSFNPRDHAQWPAGWEQDALNYRALEWWDTDRAAGVVKMIAQCLAILATGTPLYIAYNWWSHALECVGMRWNASKTNGIVWTIKNSHNEEDVIELADSKGVPDEAYGVRSVSWQVA